VLDVGDPLASLPFGSPASINFIKMRHSEASQAKSRMTRANRWRRSYHRQTEFIDAQAMSLKRLSLPQLLSSRCGDLIRFESELSLQLFQWSGGSEGVHTDDTA